METPEQTKARIDAMFVHCKRGDGKQWRGGKETMNKETATAKAKALATAMGKGWTPVVWENIGWHFKASFHNLVHIYGPSCDADRGGYYCMIGRGGMLAMFAPPHAHHKDPKQALKTTFEGYRDNVDHFNKEQRALLDACERGMGRKPGHFYVVVQEGGSTGEYYVHGFDTNAQAHGYRRKSARASYNTSMPIKVPEGTDVDVLQEIATAIGGML